MKTTWKTNHLFDLSHSIVGAYLSEKEFPWQILPEIGALALRLGEKLPPERFDQPSENVWIAKTAKISEKATILPPCIIGENTEVRPGAFLRGNVIVGEKCVVGNSSELKNCILFDCVQVPHYNYVGDSILGFHAHMGAGAITSNVKGDKSPVCIHGDEKTEETGLKKCGAFLGDYAEIGCQTVLNPGTVIGRHTTVYPLCSVRGTVPEECIYKAEGNIVTKIKE